MASELGVGVGVELGVGVGLVFGMGWVGMSRVTLFLKAKYLKIK